MSEPNRVLFPSSERYFDSVLDLRGQHTRPQLGELCKAETYEFIMDLFCNYCEFEANTVDFNQS